MSIHGRVLDTAHKAQPDVTVRLQSENGFALKEAQSNASGEFTFQSLAAGAYRLQAEKAGQRSKEISVKIASPQVAKVIEIVLEGSNSEGEGLHAGAPASTTEMEFADKPNFTVAGITDWTAVGGHGSDSILRTSETLARDTLVLKPESQESGVSMASSGQDRAAKLEASLRAAADASPGSFEANRNLGEFYLRAGKFGEAVAALEAAYKIDPKSRSNAVDLVRAYAGSGSLSKGRQLLKALMNEKQEAASAPPSDAALYRLAGELDEKLGDPLSAVREFEQAVHLEPSEPNYFAWGSELLLHRAIWQAQEVFESGLKAYPNSARIETALGTALFAEARYEDAALRLCAASDLDPRSPEPYLFMGRIGMVTPASVPCLEEKLARFVREQPENSQANYLYAMTILKRQEQAPDAQAVARAEQLLNRAVQDDTQCADGYLELGILSSSRREFHQAIDLYVKAIAANPKLADAHYRLGVAYDRIGEREKAKAEFRAHDDLVSQQAASVEAERREVKQFLVVLNGQTVSPSTP